MAAVKPNIEVEGEIDPKRLQAYRDKAQHAIDNPSNWHVMVKPADLARFLAAYDATRGEA